MGSLSSFNVFLCFELETVTISSDQIAVLSFERKGYI